MLKKTMMTAATAVLMFNVNTLTASAYSPMPEVSAKAPVTTPADGSYKLAQRVRRGNRVRRNPGSRRGGRNRGRNIGLGIAAGIIGLQIHSGPPSEAWYRNIRIREISTAE